MTVDNTANTKTKTSSSLKKKTLLGSAWVLAGMVARNGIRFGSNLALTYLLAPDLMGTMTLVSVFILGLQSFSDLGTGQSIIQNKRGYDPVFLKTAFTLQVLRGIAVFLVACILAWPFSRFYSNVDSLVWYIPVASLAALMTGLTSTRMATSNKAMQFGRVTTLDTATYLFSVVVMIAWAWIHPSVWALVAGSVVAAGSRTLLSHTWLPGHKDGFGWDAESRKDLLSYGKWVFVSTILMFISMQLDKFLLPKVFGMTFFGVYGIAFLLSDMMRQIIVTLGPRVVFPAMSALAHLPREEIRRKIARYRWLILCGCGAYIALGIGFGDLVIKLLYPEEFEGAGWMFIVLTAGTWFRALTFVTGPAIAAVGNTKYNALGSILRLILITGGMYIGYKVAYISGTVVAIGLCETPYYISISLGAYVERLTNFRQDILATFMVVILIGVCVGLRLLLGWDLTWVAEMSQLARPA